MNTYHSDLKVSQRLKNYRLWHCSPTLSSPLWIIWTCLESSLLQSLLWFTNFSNLIPRTVWTSILGASSFCLAYSLASSSIKKIGSWRSFIWTTPVSLLSSASSTRCYTACSLKRLPPYPATTSFCSEACSSTFSSTTALFFRPSWLTSTTSWIRWYSRIWSSWDKKWQAILFRRCTKHSGCPLRTCQWRICRPKYSTTSWVDYFRRKARVSTTRLLESLLQDSRLFYSAWSMLSKKTEQV